MLKQIIVFREDLLQHPKITLGKIAGQISHASMLWLASRADSQAILLSSAEQEWLTSSMTKIVLVCSDHKELLSLFDHLKQAGIATYQVIDEGKTVFLSPTLTCIATCPIDSAIVDPITRNLKLLR